MRIKITEIHPNDACFVDGSEWIGKTGKFEVWEQYLKGENGEPFYGGKFSGNDGFDEYFCGIRYVEAEPINMYGCTPCPRCKAVFRWPLQDVDGLTIMCDDCDYQEVQT